MVTGAFDCARDGLKAAMLYTYSTDTKDNRDAQLLSSSEEEQQQNCFIDNGAATCRFYGTVLSDGTDSTYSRDFSDRVSAAWQKRTYMYM